ncbi:MAG: tripartite tricarboxylate transporter substrate binding protein [Deltaproteobacteria bacterium]|nr:tripartite tricarboxylate transporter substrate binding protein [Deltaproteobacteria bacterium]
MKKQFRFFLSKMTFLGIMLMAFLVAGSQTVIGQDKIPSESVTIIVPFSVGGGTDAWARTFAAALSSKKFLRQDVSVSNLPGGQDLRGIGEAFNAKPDGYTLVFFNPPSSPFAWYLHKPKWDIRKLTGIGVYAKDPQVMVARAGYEHKNLKDLMDAISKGEEPKIGLSGLGGIEHIAALLFSKRFNVPLKKFIPYNATADVVSALIRNEVDIAFGSFTAMQSSIEEGNLVGLAVAGQTERSPVIPDVPTFSEFGDPLLELTFSRSIYGPPGLPADIQQYLEKQFMAAQEKDVLLQARFNAYSIKPAMGTGKDAEEQLLRAITLAEELEIEKLLKK